MCIGKVGRYVYTVWYREVSSNFPRACLSLQWRYGIYQWYSFMRVCSFYMRHFLIYTVYIGDSTYFLLYTVYLGDSIFYYMQYIQRIAVYSIFRGYYFLLYTASSGETISCYIQHIQGILFSTIYTIFSGHLHHWTGSHEGIKEDEDEDEVGNCRNTRAPIAPFDPFRTFPKFRSCGHI